MGSRCPHRKGRAVKLTHDYCVCDHKSHQIVLHDDGTVETPDHPEALAQGRRMAAFARLGKPVALEGCSTVVAIAHSADMICTLQDEVPTPWKAAFHAYGSNHVVVMALAAAQARRQLHGGHLAARLMRELIKCSWHNSKSKMELHFGLKDFQVKAWGVVQTDPLKLPLQDCWLDLANNGPVVFGDKLVVGQSNDNPRIMFAVYRDADAGCFRVGSFQYDQRARKLTSA